MKEFEIQEDHEFFEQPIGEAVMPDDRDIDVYVGRDKILESSKNFITQYVNNTRLVSVTVTCEFTDGSENNYVSIEHHIR
jgi:hypothetical protein